MPYTGTRKLAERRRMRAMAMLDRGRSQAEIARQLGVTPAAVSQWAKARREGGDKALKAKPHPGPKPKLSPKQLERLEKYLERGARKHGYETDRWTLPRVVELVHKHFGVTYEPSGLWHVLRRMGWWKARKRTPSKRPGKTVARKSTKSRSKTKKR